MKKAKTLKLGNRIRKAAAKFTKVNDTERKAAAAKAAKAAKTQSAKLTALDKINSRKSRSERVVLAIIRPNTGKLTRGYQFALETKENLQLIGEIALARKFNGLKEEKAAAVEKICVKSLDFAEVLAVGWKFVCDNQFVPCRAIRLYGEGAAKIVAAKKRVTDHFHELTKAAAEANAALVEAATKAGSGDIYRKRVREAAAKSATAAAAVEKFRRTYEDELKGYEKRVKAALSIISSFADLRKA